MRPRPPADPLRTLVVADDDESGREVAARLGAGVRAPDWRSATEPEQAHVQVQSHRPHVVVLALGSLQAAERHAFALQAGGEDERPLRARPLQHRQRRRRRRACAARQLIDDYVQYFPVPVDRERLAASMRLAARITAAGRAAAATARASAAPRRPVVLVVEDDVVLHTLVAAMLESRSGSTSSSRPTAAQRSSASAPSRPTSC